VSFAQVDKNYKNLKNISFHALFISVEYPASLLRGWKTSQVTVNNNMIHQFHFLVLTSAQTKCLRLLFPLTEFGGGREHTPLLLAGCTSTNLFFQ
jgi:hypothetical protein